MFTLNLQIKSGIKAHIGDSNMPQYIHTHDLYIITKLT